MYKAFGKRALDILCSSVIIILSSPILLVSAIWIKLDSKGPVFFYQTRVGKKNTRFNAIKFRTMTDKKRDPSKHQTYLGDPEITRIGKYLRRYKIDELPQIFNVFFGDMSLVGPRPTIVEVYEKYGDKSLKRLEATPGMTGLAQVNGNIFLTWEERFVYDNKYVDSISFTNDMKILLKTVKIVLFGEEKYLKK